MDIVCPVAHERFSVADVYILEYRLDNCPLVPVPPHGRLIGADALEATFWDGQCYFTAAIKRRIREAPTVIPADVIDTSVGHKEEGEP